MLISSANVYGDQGRFYCQLEEPRQEKTCVGYIRLCRTKTNLRMLSTV